MELEIILGVFLSLLFNFVNGLNNAGNSIATVVATRALPPFKALILASICTMAGPFLLTTAIAKTIGTSIISPGTLTPVMILVALISAILLVTTMTEFGFPISATHALIGCLIGAAIADSGPLVVIWPTQSMISDFLRAGIIGMFFGSLYLAFITWILDGPVKIGIIAGAIGGFSLMIPGLMIIGVLQISGLLAILVFIVVSPTIGFIAAFAFDIIITWLFRRSKQRRMRRIFRPLQICAGGVQAIGNGANDGLHAVGVIGALFMAAEMTSSFTIPFWVMAASALSIGLGTFFGGWKVITRMARNITRLRAYQGFCASSAGGCTVSLLTLAGIPTSSTHIIGGAIVGVGATRGKNAVKWGVVREIVIAWIITIPVSCVTAYIVYKFTSAGLSIL
ncbi:MAG TPA: inorganic phosphate transporter [Methanospirillum sp.]|nr:inorganic phosphate transporter [Methanospirillum sp.]